jgi:hypothetical protein
MSRFRQPKNLVAYLVLRRAWAPCVLSKPLSKLGLAEPDCRNRSLLTHRKASYENLRMEANEDSINKALTN